MRSWLVYLAGPLYTPAQRDYLEDLRDSIEGLDQADIEVVVPHHHTGMADEESGEKIFQENIDHLEEADAIVAVLSGFDVDAGTAFEVGYGFRKGIPIFGVYEDARIPDESSGDDSAINLMLSNAMPIASSKGDLTRKIQKAYRDDNEDGG